MAVNADTVFAGLGFTSTTITGNQPAGYGYYLSTNGDDDWEFIDFPLDPFSDDDTTFVYGGITYDRLRIIVPEQSPPYSVDFKGDVLFSANWASGLLRSTDFGTSWERIVLPPFGEDELTPTRTDYEWFDCVTQSAGQCVESRNFYNSVDDDNLKGFSIYIDSQNRVWFGSAGGINISDNALTAPVDSIRWRNIGFEDDPDGLLARWIIEINEDPLNGRIWMTNWLAESTGSRFQGLDNFGLVFTDDGGATFQQRLIGEKILSIGFKDSYVFAAGENGLFISDDSGDTWIESGPIKSPNSYIKNSAEFQSVAVTNDRVWIGTTDGIASTDDFGQSWEITRVNFPLEGGNQYDDEAKSVDSYAYPNPFSPQIHDVVRIRFNVENEGSVSVKIMDFGMNLVREISENVSQPGDFEVLWNGLDRQNRKVANGVYFYVVEAPGKTVNGKILVVE
jgi:hypothetical protein